MPMRKHCCSKKAHSIDAECPMHAVNTSNAWLQVCLSVSSKQEQVLPDHAVCAGEQT